ncbi:MAG: tyrosine-protein phosphatase [Dehalococcoidia bacterium]
MEATLGRILDNEVEGAVNLRDLGGHATPAGRVRHGLVYRSAMTHHITPAGLSGLSETLGIRTVVDFRNPSELEADGVAPFDTVGIRHKNFAVSAQTVTTPEEQRARLHAIRDGQVSWNVLYTQMTQTGRDAFAGFFNELADAESLPLLFHCTGGRDRTGIAAALLLASLGVSDDDIAHDYSLTGAALVPHIDRFDRNMREMDMTREQWNQLVATTPEPIHEFLGSVRSEYGGVTEFLATLGVGLSMQRHIRERLVA